MTAPTGWWCPNCGHTVNAPKPPCPECNGTGWVKLFDTPAEWGICSTCRPRILVDPSGVPVGDQPHPELTSRTGYACVCGIGGACLIHHTFGDLSDPEPDKPMYPPVGVPVGDDTPAPTADRWSVVDGELRYRYALGAWVGIPRDRLRSGPDGDRAYDDLVALVRRAGAAPDLTALEPPRAEVRALRALAAVVADDFETSGATYTGPEVAMTLRSVFRAATADPTPHTRLTIEEARVEAKRRLDALTAGPTPQTETCGYDTGGPEPCGLPEGHDGDCFAAQHDTRPAAKAHRAATGHDMALVSAVASSCAECDWSAPTDPTPQTENDT